MPQTDTIIRTSRVFKHSPERIFSAFADPARLARWWGPAGFTNSFHVFEFKPGGPWVFTMHGPNGTDYPNECVFREIEPNRIVIEHTGEPHFLLELAFNAKDGGTELTWSQQFDSPEVAERVRPICEPANEQNLDRLAAVLEEGE